MNLLRRLFMSQMIEIRWHGRGGQGAKTAAMLLAEAAIHDGKFIQAFPEYGPERMGAPVQSFNRISDEPLTMHCSLTNPNVVMVLDPSLMEAVDVSAGLSEEGTLIINTPSTPAEIRKSLHWNGKKLFTVNASQIAMDTIKRDVPNTPMMGALIKATGLMRFESMLEDTKHKLEKKFKNRPEVIEGNVQAIRRAYEEVKSL
jgi:pyruvate ferredoxin oxidoreductase gamma subunit